MVLFQYPLLPSGARARFLQLVFILFVTFTIFIPSPHSEAAACSETPTTSSLTVGSVTYTVKTFTNTSSNNCTWAIPTGVSSVELLLVGGGGGAGFGNLAGGGGAGRVVVSESGIPVTPGQNITISVGAGGTGGWQGSSNASWYGGRSGETSTVTISGSTYSASGGGGGGGNLETTTGLIGGSGGGGNQGTLGGSADTSVIAGFFTYQNVGAEGRVGIGGGGGGGGGSEGLRPAIDGSKGGTGGSGIEVWGVKLAGGGGGWPNGDSGTLTGTPLGGAALGGTATKDASGDPGVAGTGSGGGGGNDGGSGRVAIRYVVDSTAPTVTSVSSNSSNATYRTGDVLDIRVTFSETVTVTGTPQLTLETGAVNRNINYSSGSGSTTLTFNYTIQTGDVTSDLDYFATTSLSLNGGTIKDAALNNATLTLASPGAANSLSANKNLAVDGTVTTSIGNSSSVSLNVSDTYTVLNNSLSLADSITISGFADNVRVVVSTDTGTVQITTTTSLNTVTGYDNSSSLGIAGDEIAFEGTVASAQAAINSLRYGANSVTGTATISISVSYVGTGTVSFNSENGHYYITYSPNLTWQQAYDSTTASANCGIVFNGLCGYLATSTSETETTFIKDKTAGTEVWLGGSDTATEGTWRWPYNSPEAGAIFFKDFAQNAGTVNVNYCADGLKGYCPAAVTGGSAQYNYWNSGEPNDSGSNEDALQVTAGSNGYWNDLPTSSSTLPYLVEFGGKGETPTYQSRTRSVIIYYTKPTTVSPTLLSTPSCPTTTITSLSPSGGTSSGGTRLTITGSGLTSSVYINGRIADVRLSSSNAVTLLTPAGTKGTATVRIDGCNTSASTTYLYDPDPVISSLSTISIATSGGAITITGSFLSGASITIGTTRAAISSNTDALITASLPPSTAGEKVMTLTTPFGSTTSKLTYLEPPALKATLPAGYIAQGDLVSLSLSATGASSYSASGTLPQGLSFNTTTGLLSGIATKEGIYNFSITASNAAGSDTKNYTLDIDRPTPRPITTNLYFSHKNSTLSPSNKASLDRFITRINSVAPRNLSTTITMTGGAGNSKTSLTNIRHEQIKRYLEASGIKFKSTTTSGSASKVEVAVTWTRL